VAAIRRNGLYILFFKNILSDRYDKHIDIGKRKRRRIHLRIFDTAGQEEMVALWEQHLKDKDTGKKLI